MFITQRPTISNLFGKTGGDSKESRCYPDGSNHDSLSQTSFSTKLGQSSLRVWGEWSGVWTHGARAVVRLSAASRNSPLRNAYFMSLECQSPTRSWPTYIFPITGKWQLVRLSYVTVAHNRWANILWAIDTDPFMSIQYSHVFI